MITDTNNDCDDDMMIMMMVIIMYYNDNDEYNSYDYDGDDNFSRILKSLLWNNNNINDNT